MWTYSQSSGEMKNAAGTVVATGYSGLASDKDVPADQNIQGKGPIPRGFWNITDCIDSQQTGPMTLVLAPESDTDVFGRSAFRIHGDSIVNPGQASHGCIIMPRPIREEIWASKDYRLNVVE